MKTLSDYFSNIKESGKELMKGAYRKAAPYALAAAASLPFMYDGNNVRGQTLAQHQDKTDVSRYHVDVNPNLTTDTRPLFNNLQTAIDFNYSTSTTLPRTIHVAPGNYSNGTTNFTINSKSDLWIVGDGPSAMLSDYTQGITEPLANDIATLRNELEVNSGSNVHVVNLHLSPDNGGEVAQISGADSIKFFNNYIGGSHSRTGNLFAAGVTIGFTSTKSMMNNNLVHGMFNGTDGQGFSVRGEGSFYNNIVYHSKDGIYSYNSAKIDLGSVDTPGNNVFIANRSTNMTSDIGDINTINAKLNTWYDVATTAALQLASSTKTDTSWGNPLTDENYIKSHTIAILNPTPRPSISNNKILKAVKDIIIHPIKLGDKRFGYQAINSAGLEYLIYE